MRKVASQIGVLDDDAVRAAQRDEGLDLLQGRIGTMGVALGRAEIGDDPPASLGDREERQDAVLVPEDVQAVLRLEPADMAVGQVPVAGLASCRRR